MDGGDFFLGNAPADGLGLQFSGLRERTVEMPLETRTVVPFRLTMAHQYDAR
jgi:hypothetical protein